MSQRDETETQLTVRRLLDDAASYIDEEVSPDRVLAARYYAGEPFGDEEDGRSKVVSRDVSDTVRAMLPSLMRVFFSGERVVEFAPVGPEDTDLAEQATDYINYVFTRDNSGFLALHSAIKDALLKRTGAIKTWWDDSVKVEFEDYEGLDDAALQLLEDDPEVTVLEQTSYPDEEALARQEMELQAMLAQGGEMPPEMPQPMRHDVSIRRNRSDGRIRVEAIPPEELLVARGARSFHDAELVAHRVELTVSDLVAMGYEQDAVEEHLHAAQLRANEERMQRHPEDWDTPGGDTATGMRKVLYTEAWIKLDEDGDGIAELRKYCCLGDTFEVMRSEPASFVPIADLCPDPEPHRAIGQSLADLVMDVQRIKSQIMRNMLDSLAQSIHPRTGVVEGEVNMDDVLNGEVGGIVRMRRPGMVMPLDTPFVGREAFPALEYMDRLKEKRTGVTDATQGLDASTLQSTTASAVNATVEAAQQQIELIARIFAETGITTLYRNLLKLVTQYQDQPRTIRLRGEWVTMDPRSWNAGMDVTVDPALGIGTWEHRLETLNMIAQKQETILQTLGPQNPLVNLGQYSNTLLRLAEAAGYRDAERYFTRLPPNFQMPPQEQEGESPEQMLAAVQRESIQADMQKKQAELQMKQMETEARLRLDREKMMRDDDRERDRIEADAIIRAREKNIDPAPILELMRRNRELEQQGYFQ